MGYDLRLGVETSSSIIEVNVALFVQARELSGSEIVEDRGRRIRGKLRDKCRPILSAIDNRHLCSLMEGLILGRVNMLEEILRIRGQHYPVVHNYS